MRLTTVIVELLVKFAHFWTVTGTLSLAATVKPPSRTRSPRNIHKQKRERIDKRKRERREERTSNGNSGRGAGGTNYKI